MKKFIEENFWWIMLIVFTTATVVTMCLSTSEYWLYRVITAPFVLLGFWVIVAGGFKVVEEFESHTSKTWQMLLLFCVSIFSVVVLLIYINR